MKKSIETYVDALHYLVTDEGELIVNDPSYGLEGDEDEGFTETERRVFHNLIVAFNKMTDTERRIVNAILEAVLGT